MNAHGLVVGDDLILFRDPRLPHQSADLRVGQPPRIDQLVHIQFSPCQPHPDQGGGVIRKPEIQPVTGPFAVIRPVVRELPVVEDQTRNLARLPQTVNPPVVLVHVP